MYTFYNQQDDYNRQTNKLVSDIEKAINGEYSAIVCYAKIAEMAPTDKIRDQILEIRNDEIKHFHTFGQIYVNLTGMQPQPKIIEECPDTFVKGVEFALQDEQKTVDFYMDIMDETSDLAIKEAFRRAAAAEQHHAVWFLYYFSKVK